MATKVRVIYLDDLTGEELPQDQVQQVPFSFDGVEYEIDLTPHHAAELRTALAPYVGAGRRIPRTRRRRGTTKAPAGAPPRRRADSNRLEGIREWAREHGYPVADHGRLPAAVLQAYTTACEQPVVALPEFAEPGG